MREQTKQTGILYGIGVGPGDPELMTLKAVRHLRECPILAIPHKEKEKCVAYQIAVQSVPELKEKRCLFLHMPMTKDSEILKVSHRNAAIEIMNCLDRGEDVALITLGDSTIYSTCLYLLEQVVEQGYETVLVNGIPSFCAAAARLNMPLVNGAKELHIIPASYQVEEAMSLKGVKVFMKSGSRFSEVKKALEVTGQQAVMVENCGMPGERVITERDRMPENPGYYTLLIVSDSQQKEG